MSNPRTIHDFGGFPPNLYKVEYPAPGHEALALRVSQLLAPTKVRQDLQWGLDHGTWSVLMHIYPKADVPVVQLSLDSRQPWEYHYELGRKLRPLREEGVLIVGSGDIVHNLGAVRWRGDTSPYEWAERFDAKVREKFLEREHHSLIYPDALDQDMRLAVPTPDHYLPLLYIAGLQRDDDPVAFPVTGIDLGAISMTAVQVG